MHTFDEKTTVVGVSELRTKIDKILKEAQKNKVLIGRRNKLIAVLLDIHRYREMEKTLNALEDFALGFLAQEREKSSDLSDYVDIDDVE